jgi:hypothetical protein
MEKDLSPPIPIRAENPREEFRLQILAEACLAVSRDMENYDYQIGRLIRKVSCAIEENPEWSRDEEHLLNLIRSAAAGFGGRRERVWRASFDCSLDTPELA